MTPDPDDTSGRWAVTWGRAPGHRHTKDGTPCQDACAVAVRPDGVCVAAVADGMGSAVHAADGAAEAVAAAMAELAALFPAVRQPDPAAAPAAFARLLTAVRRRVQALAAGRGHSVRDYAATLAVFAAAPDWVAAAAVGDGFVTARLGAAGHAVLLPPDRGEFAAETYSAVGDDAYDRLRVAVRPGPVWAVFASSDGLLEHALVWQPGDTWTPHQPFFRNLIEPQLAAPALPPERVAEFLTDPRIDTSERDDDKSLVCALARTGAA